MTAPGGCLLRGQRGDTAGPGGRERPRNSGPAGVQSGYGYPRYPSRRDAGVMTSFTHDTAPTQYAEGGGIRFAYRRFGVPGRPPLVFFQHFMGTMDDHDPALSDAFAGDREVILFNNTGVASSSGTVPDTIEAMARDAITFIDALGLTTIDVVRPLDGRSGRPGGHPRPPGPGAPPGAGRHRATRRRGHRRTPRPGSRSCSPASTSGRKTCGCRSCSRRPRPARRPGVPTSSASSPAPTATPRLGPVHRRPARGARSVRRRQGPQLRPPQGPGADRSWSSTAPMTSHPDDQLLHPAAVPSRRRAHPVPGRRSRLHISSTPGCSSATRAYSSTIS